MKKGYFPFFLIIILVIISLLLTGKREQNEQNNNYSPTQNQKQEENHYHYYKEELKSRYLEYQKKFPDKSEEEIITNVNLNLDYPFYTHTIEATKQNEVTILVNKYRYLEDDFVPDNLEEISDEYSKGGIYLVKEAKDNFMRLVDDAKKGGYTIRAISSYRGYTYQKNLYERYLQQDGEEVADTYSARPGFSDHQTGLAVDVANGNLGYEQFDKTEEFKWMMNNASNYGFILRYPKGKEEITGYQYESWHYRYVGIELAKKIKASNLTFDEYYIRYLDF